MTTGTLIWILLYIVAAFFFFGVASVIAIVGIRDLKELLSRSAEEK